MGKLHTALKKAQHVRDVERAHDRAGERANERAQERAITHPTRGPAAAAAGAAADPAVAAGTAAAPVDAAPPAAAGGAPAATDTAAVYVPTALRSDMDPHLVPVVDPRSPIAEQYRSLRTNLLALAAANSWKMFLVTSAVPGEGKSVSAANLACVLAEQPDRKVVLIDADLRKPSQHELFALDNQRGLADYLSGGTLLEMALQKSRLSNLWVLPAGRAPANPAELLSNKRMDDLIARLRRDYDFVVIDTPPVVSTTDAAVLAPRADGTLLVVRMEKTQRDVARHAVDQLAKAKANVVGTVLTGLQDDVAGYHHYPYHGNERAAG